MAYNTLQIYFQILCFSNFCNFVNVRLVSFKIARIMSTNCSVESNVKPQINPQTFKALLC